MAVMNQPWLLFPTFLFFFIIPLSFSQSFSPQNIETSYPFPIGIPSPEKLPPLLRQNSSNRAVVKAVAATAASTFVAATLLFFMVRRFVILRRRSMETDANSSQPAVVSDEFSRVDGNVKGLIVDENGLDVLYWRKLEGEYKKNGLSKEIFQGDDDDEQEEEDKINQTRRKAKPVQEIPLLGGRSPSSHEKVVPEMEFQDKIIALGGDIQSADPGYIMRNIGTANTVAQPSNLPLPLLPPPPGQSVSTAISNRKGPQPPPPPPPMPANKTPPPPAPLQSVTTAMPNRQGSGIAPPPPPVPAKKTQTPPPPPPPKAGNQRVSLQPIPACQGMPTSGKSGDSSTGNAMAEAGHNGQVKLKPLHWDKVQKNPDQSMVWDKIEGGSFRFNDDLMEALFGYVAINRKSPQLHTNTTSPRNSNSTSPKKIALLEARRSQNIAIVLKSLAISRKELLDALTDGQGLDQDILEKLNKIAPTKEEESEIMGFHGDHRKLADAESFLYHLLKAIPSAFTRIDAMLFRSNYDAEVIHFKKHLQVLESACQELRSRGLLTKLLEAILKAGNRMNAGTSRGNAQAFKLTSLQKLSDVKSTDGKTTLLHFVVEEVVRYEGKRCVINRNRSLSKSNSQSSVILERPESKEEKEKEYIMMGLPVVGGLSAEFSNVIKSANIDYDSFANTCTSIGTRASEVRQLVTERVAKGGGDGGGGFVKEIEGFLEAAEQELKSLKEEQKRVMETVRKTSEYYQADGTKDQGSQRLQIFVIIKDFLAMVDHACVEIARNLQKRKTSPSASGSSPKSPATSVAVRFPILTEHFMKEKYRGSSSDSDSDL